MLAKRHLILSTLIAVLFPLTSLAGWTPAVHHFSPADYSAGTQNWDMVQQANGWMYVANNYGLLETDGFSWHLYGIHNATAIRSVALGKDGAIYVGGTDEFGVFTPNELGELHYENLSLQIPERYRQFGEVWHMQVANDMLYVQTRYYIFICEANGEIEVLDPGSIIYNSLFWEGDLYVATARDLYVYTGNRLHVLHDAELLRGTVVCGLLPYGNEGMMIATDFQGLYLYDGQSIRPFTTDADSYISTNQLYTLAINDHQIAFGTVLGGVVLTDLQGQNAKYLTRTDGLQNNTVLSLLFDAQGNLWMGLDKGIDVINSSNPVLLYRDEQIDYGSGYSCIEHAGMLYMGTNQGLYAMPHMAASLTFVEGSQGQVWNVCEIGGTLFCCHNRGLFIVHDMRLQALDCEDGVWNICPISDSTAIVGSYAGFYYLYRQKKDWHLQALQGVSETALYYTLDAAGHIWFLSSRGVERLTLHLDEYRLESQLMIAQDAAQRIYSLARWGENVYLTADQYFGVVNKDGVLMEDSLAAQRLAGMHRYLRVAEDVDKNLWLIHDDCISVREYDASTQTYQDEQVVVYSPSLLIGGFANMSFPQAGGVIVGGVDGFHYLRVPTDVTHPANHIYVRRVTTLNENPVLLYGESYDLQVQALTIPPYERVLRVQLSGSYIIDDPLLFRTRLYPLEESFTPWTPSSYRDLIGLPTGGDFRLDIEMQSTQTGQIYTRSLPIKLVYPPYLSRWARLGYIILAALLLAWTIWVIYRKVQYSKRRLTEEKNREIYQQQMRILQLENERAQADLRSKSQELSNILLSEANRKEWNEEVLNEIRRIVDCLNTDRISEAKGKIQHLQHRLARNGERTINWKRFEENFDIVNNQFITHLTALYPWMNKQERRMCVYIHIGLTSKEIAPLLNLSIRGAEMMRYRIRIKMNIDASMSLKQHLFEIQQHQAEHK